uniref:Gfo/Idh/MocA-like oxidoreductase N-terminal domain-containing protein n=1 Tax=Odontella aurita TaxID=265563 RepID=A0A7S4K6K3_9STRA|mmetsp:Transcript_62205/g.183965  ORF Transcript_62205/g.183965 Transcript_62205/m.183965 type:complete len:470 (+) Transcript_62205:502-1911(+)
MAAFRSKRNPFFASRYIIIFIILGAIISADAILGRKKKKKKQEAEFAAQKAAEETARKEKVIVLGGKDFEKKSVYVLGCGTFLALSVGFFLSSGIKKKKRGNNDVDGTLDVVIVGCGLPKKGMGWYHLTQLLEMKQVNVRAVVEPFYLNKKVCKDIPNSFKELMVSLHESGVECVADINKLVPFSKATLCLIAGRTSDNPALFRQCVHKGASVIYLEKPGAPSVRELNDMKALAETQSVKTYIGYNKNVTPYVQKAIELSQKVDNSHVFFCHNNSYSQADLPEVFARNPEGMLKNMVIHELALLVTFFGVTVDVIEKFEVNTRKLFSEKITTWKPGTSMPNPEYITDFSRVAFLIKTKKGREVSVMADRCGGNVSFAVVKDAKRREIKKFEFPDTDTARRVEEQVRADPEMMPYFFIQSDDYLELKNRVINATLAGKDAEGVATISIGIEALKLAEYGTAEINKALKSS